MNLFQGEYIFLHSQEATDFKIECDALTEEDLAALAKVISKRISFRSLYAIPRGGDRLAVALNKYRDPKSKVVLIVDDVLTTGSSFRQAKATLKAPEDVEIRGVCIFCRRPENKPEWVEAVFSMWGY